MAGGAAGAFGGHKAGHGVLGALGGAILGSLTEDYAKKNKHHQKNKHGNGNGSSMSGGLAPMASGFFNSHKK